MKKIILGIVFTVILISWPISLIKKPTQIKFETIFYSITESEKIDFEKKLALDTSWSKKIYYNKITIYKERYLKNFLILIDLNNYFFEMHPREDISGVNYRFKYPFWTIVFFIVGVFTSLNNKKKLKIWLFFLIEIILLSFFKDLDGIDFILFIPISYFIYLGVKKISEYRYSWILNLGLIVLMIIEIWRVLL